MKISDEGIKYLAKLEGNFKIGDLHYPYDDETGKRTFDHCYGATIGYGHKIFNEEHFKKYLDGISEEDALNLLGDDVTSFSLTCEDKITADLTQKQFDACVIFCFNIGKMGFRQSSALKLINNTGAPTKYIDMDHAWAAWNKGRIKGEKQVIRGLVIRRKKEIDLFNGGEYA